MQLRKSRKTTKSTLSVTSTFRQPNMDPEEMQELYRSESLMRNYDYDLESLFNEIEYDDYDMIAESSSSFDFG